jgi:hypothetical protein
MEADPSQTCREAVVTREEQTGSQQSANNTTYLSGTKILYREWLIQT